jgi:hypothetical protein
MNLSATGPDAFGPLCAAFFISQATTGCDLVATVKGAFGLSLVDNLSCYECEVPSFPKLRYPICRPDATCPKWMDGRECSVILRAQLLGAFDAFGVWGLEIWGPIDISGFGVSKCEKARSAYPSNS